MLLSLKTTPLIASEWAPIVSPLALVISLQFCNLTFNRDMFHGHFDGPNFEIGVKPTRGRVETVWGPCHCVYPGSVEDPLVNFDLFRSRVIYEDSPLRVCGDQEIAIGGVGETGHLASVLLR